MKIIWQVDDGYVGGNRPHTTEIPDDELENCETEEERKELISEYIQDDFNNIVSWYIIDTIG